MDPKRIMSDDQKRDRFKHYFKKKEEQTLLQQKSELEKEAMTNERLKNKLANRPRPILPK